MTAWTIQEDVSGNDEIGQEEVGSWAVDGDFVPSVEKGAWGMSKASLSPNATAENSFLSFGGHAASEYGFLPTDVNILPLVTQSDHTEWTIQVDPPIND